MTFLAVKHICLMTIISYLFGTVQSRDYCKLGADHTMCKFKEEKVGEKCGKGAKIYNLTPEDKKVFLKTHNDLRSGIAQGKEKDKCCPEAADMGEVLWDDELYTVAHRWIMQCDFSHDKMRKIERFSVGQNIASSSSSADYKDKKEAIKNAINNWYSEVKDMKPESFKIAAPASGAPTIGHFTQVVWGKIRYIGCALQEYEEKGGMKTTFIGCNYGPDGNMIGDDLYKKGKPCSQCLPGEHCSSEYKGLCTSKAGAKGREKDDEKGGGGSKGKEHESGSEKTASAISLHSFSRVILLVGSGLFCHCAHIFYNKIL